VEKKEEKKKRKKERKTKNKTETNTIKMFKKVLRIFLYHDRNSQTKTGAMCPN
jgi:hypothetical protein